jgi:hypothetical protein
VNIRFTSSLTPEDENLLAPGLLRALTSILDLLPITYLIRIDTSDARSYQVSGGGEDVSPADRGLPPPRRRASDFAVR